MDKIAVVADADTLIGFKLAGITETFECLPGREDEVISSALEKSGVGILVIAENIASAVSTRTKRLMDASTKPVVVIVPGKTAKAGSASGENIAAMVKRAIGVDLSK